MYCEVFRSKQIYTGLQGKSTLPRVRRLLEDWRSRGNDSTVTFQQRRSVIFCGPREDALGQTPVSTLVEKFSLAVQELQGSARVTGQFKS
jgi:hypothetical protein